MKIGTNQTANDIQDTTVLVERNEQVTETKTEKTVTVGAAADAKDLSNGKATDKTNTHADSAHQQRHRRSARK